MQNSSPGFRRIRLCRELHDIADSVPNRGLDSTSAMGGASSNLSFSSENSNEYALPVPMQNKRRCKELLMYKDSRSMRTSLKELSVEGTLCDTMAWS